ncbi:single-stranded-DNA-specific exonuclease RecJ [Tenuifilaceae bacterium CYCD]|nr:single-stranded-DNA-specific exonuclease RecJ [Tenuifilaceae bacterium CYCD]
MMEKRWVYKDQGDPELVNRLASELSIEPVLASLLVQRGVKTYDEAKRFFRPSLDDLYDPFLMKDMHNAVDRIEQAIRKGERILFYGDYDVDGTTAVALMYSFFRSRYSKIGYYIPDRYNEGYGISLKGIDFAFDNGYSLIVALDCGIKAIEKIRYATQRKIDFIICDHHLPGDQIPEAVAVLDPKRVDCPYPFKELSGCGVGFKLLQGYSRKVGIDPSELYSHIDLVAVSIASDIVPIIDENRVLAYFGLEKLNSNPSKGLKSIIKIANIEKQQLAIDDIVFRIGPRINAAGRMESGKTAVDLLCADDDTIANEVGSLIDSCNNDRKSVDRNITHEALRMIAGDSRMQHRYSTVIFNPSWHKGVVGIVASRLIETYYKPTVVLTQTGDLATGSARSVPGFDLYQAVEACSDLLENFGGHMYAAGLTMKADKVDEFKTRFEEYVSKNITPDLLTPQVDVDAKIKLSEISDKFYRILKQFQPFGPGNMAPVFSTKNVYDNGEGRLVGNEKEHLKLSIIEENNPTVYPGIAFQLAENYKGIHEHKPFNICFSLYENVFRGITTIQIRVKDIKFLE